MSTRWLVLAMVPWLLTGCDSGDSGSVPQEQGRHYEREGGFSLMPPEGWPVADMPGLKYKVIVGPSSNDFAPNINVVDEAYSGSLDDYVASSMEMLERMFEDFKKISQEDLRLENDTRAIKLVTHNRQHGRELQQTFYIVDGAKRKFVLTCTKLAEDKRDFAKEFEASVCTFRAEDR